MVEARTPRKLERRDIDVEMSVGQFLQTGKTNKARETGVTGARID